MKTKAFPITPQEKGQHGENLSNELLKSAFPDDIIKAEQKGVEGADIFHTVKNSIGNDCGKILWEVKNTTDWKNIWINKLKDDKSKSDNVKFAIIISKKLPEGVNGFACHNGEWVCNFDYAIPLAHLIREKLIDLAVAENLSISDKMQELHDYLTGSPFRLRIEAIVEVFNTLRSDIEKEQNDFNARCKKRIENLCKIIQSTQNLFSDLAGFNVMPKIALFDEALKEVEKLKDQSDK
ncbi:MAG: DUF2130 domain-containing protein [Rickettsiales bacterium]|jgi:hypothetical protein|nr:DUF2130 domain-containing protein [Rickettsiales bacterium]